MHSTLYYCRKNCITHHHQIKFVQFLNINESHWVCTSNIFSPPGVVDVFDSMPSCSFHSHNLHRQLAGILQCKNKTSTVCFVNVQRQAGEADCGVFAISPSLLCSVPVWTHIQSLLISLVVYRKHLLDCFNNKTLCLFPSLSKPRKKRKQVLLE